MVSTCLLQGQAGTLLITVSNASITAIKHPDLNSINLQAQQARWRNARVFLSAGWSLFGRLKVDFITQPFLGFWVLAAHFSWVRKTHFLATTCQPPPSPPVVADLPTSWVDSWVKSERAALSNEPAAYSALCILSLGNSTILATPIGRILCYCALITQSHLIQSCPPLTFYAWYAR